MSAAHRQAIRRRTGWTCEVVRDEGFTLLGRTMLDLSEQGMRVALVEPCIESGAADSLRIGEKLWVSFHAPKIALWFDFEAELTRISRGRRPGDEGPFVGLRFLQRWDAGKSMAPALSRMLLRGGLSRMPAMPAPVAARGSRTSSPQVARLQRQWLLEAERTWPQPASDSFAGLELVWRS